MANALLFLIIRTTAFFFEFKEDGVLIVSGDMDHPAMNWFFIRGLDSFFNDLIGPGTHLYMIKEINTESWSANYAFSIGDRRWSLDILTTECPWNNYRAPIMTIGLWGWGDHLLVKVRDSF